MKKPTETQLVRACIDYLNANGLFAFRVNTTGVYDPSQKRFRKFTGTKGVSDILCVLPGGRFVAIECKVGRNKPSEDQEAFMENVRKMGGLAFVARSTEDIDRELGWD